jgi:uncharacterized phage-associated protein
MIEYPYHPRRAAQAAHYLLWRSHGSLDLYGVVKLLYLADRETLLRRGYTLTGDRLASMPFGPVVSYTYDLIKGRRLPDHPEALGTWREYIRPRDGNQLPPSAPFPSDETDAAALYDELTAENRELLSSLVQRYGRYGFNRLHQIASRLPEYENVGSNSKPIDPATILQKAGWTAEDVEAAAEDAQSAVTVRRLLRIQ